MQDLRFTGISFLLASILATVGCTGGGGSGGGGGAVRAAYLDFGNAYCACETADQMQACQSGFQNQASEIDCEVGVFVREGLGSTIDCLTAEIRSRTSCLSSASCDPEAVDACLEADTTCPEIPGAIEEMAQAECGEPDFMCGDGGTVPADWRCDGEADCQDASDEANCPTP